MLHNVTKKSSCSDMAIGELFQVLKHLEDCGFKAKRPTQKQHKKKYSPKSTGQPIDVIRALWIQMADKGIVRDGSEDTLIHWVKRTTSKLNGGIGVDSLEWLARDEKMTGKVINALKQWNKRVMIQWLREDIQLIQRLCQNKPELTAKDIVLNLLETGRISYWMDFGLELGIEDRPEYDGGNRGS